MRKSSKPEYLRNVAVSLMQRLRVPSGYSPGSAQDVYEKYGDAVWIIVQRWSPETRGALAEFGQPFDKSREGKTALYLVHFGSYCDKYASGRHLLNTIAATAVIAEMYDILSEREMSLAGGALFEANDRACGRY